MTHPSTAPKALNQQVAKRLLAYATVASAAIAGCASDAKAEIIYTPTHNNINQDYYLDLNHDGIGDFHIHSYYLSGIGDLQVFPMIPINKIAGVRKGCPIFAPDGAAPLAKGAAIGPGLTFDGKANCMAVLFSYSTYGPWVGLQDRYLGFEFYIKGQKHYGWARLSVQSWTCFPCIGRIFGYAYETIPGKPIVAGDEGPATKASLEPATLGALALGAPALSLWRREDEDTTK
jgi:hypothetical protein